jgi:hypothetical protein
MSGTAQQHFATGIPLIILRWFFVVQTKVCATKFGWPFLRLPANGAYLEGGAVMLATILAGCATAPPPLTTGELVAGMGRPPNVVQTSSDGWTSYPRVQSQRAFLARMEIEGIVGRITDDCRRAVLTRL